MDGVGDDLIWSAQPALIRRDAERLLKLVPRLLGQLRQGLQRIEYPDERMGQFFDALVALHEQAFESPVLPVLTAHPTPAPTADSAPVEAAESFWMADSEAAEARRDLGKLLETLPDRQRLPIVHVKLEGLSVEETARLTGLSSSAVKVGIHRGLKALARLIRGSENDEDR